MVTGNPVFDAIGSLAIGVLLLGVAVFVGIEVKALLVGQSTEPAQRDAMLRFLNARDEVAEVLNLITLQNGTDVVVAIKVRMGSVGAGRLGRLKMNQKWFTISPFCQNYLRPSLPNQALTRLRSRLEIG